MLGHFCRRQDDTANYGNSEFLFPVPEYGTVIMSYQQPCRAVEIDLIHALRKPME